MRSLPHSLAAALCAGLLLAAGPAVARPEQALTPVLQSVQSPPRWFEGDDGRFHMQYELRLTNALPVPVAVSALDVRRGDGRRIETLSGSRLEAAMTQLGDSAPTATLAPSTIGVVWVDVSYATRRRIPRAIEHRLTYDVGPGLPIGPRISDVGGRAAVARRRPTVLAPPLRGPRWSAIIGAHRRALLPVNGRARNAQRFAIDWNRLDAEGRTTSGPPAELTSSPSYRAPVFAVADAEVVRAVDGIPDLRPGQPFTGGLPQADGNHVILRLGPRTFAGYAHLVPGSVRVRRGDRVRRGQCIGLLGNSGNSTGPHLHFQLMNRPSLPDADGLPFVLRRFRLAGRVASLEAILEADAAQTPVPIDRAGAGPRRRAGLVGFPVVTLPRR